MSAFFEGITASELDPTSRWNPRTGKTLVRRWKGDPITIGSIEIQARALGYAYDTQWDGGYLVINVDYPEDDTQASDQPLSNEWELDSNLVFQDLWQLPSVQAELKKFINTGIGDDPFTTGFDFDERRLFFRMMFDSVIDGAYQVTDPNGDPFDVSKASVLDYAQNSGGTRSFWEDYFECRARGATQYPYTHEVLKRNTITNNNSTVKASKENTLRIFTTASLQALENIEASGVKFEIPDGFWLKMKPKVSRIERSKWQIVQEFWFSENYEPFIYGEAL